MLKRLQHLGSLRLKCALWHVVAHGVFVCAVSSRRLVVRGGILACGVTLVQERSRALATLLWFARDCQTIQYSRAKFRWEGQELKLPLVGYSAPSVPGIVDSSGMIPTNKFCFPKIDLPWSCGSRVSQAPFVLPFRSSFLANSFDCGLWRSAMHSLLRLMQNMMLQRKQSRSRQNPLEGPSIADRARNVSRRGTQSCQEKERSKRR